MKRLILVVALATFLVGLSGCCSGQPTATFGLPTLSFGQSSTTPQQAIQVPMVPAYTVQSAPAYTVPAAPRSPCP